MTMHALVVHDYCKADTVVWAGTVYPKSIIRTVPHFQRCVVAPC